ncbi:hypothetical protein L917_05594 [Phytophthora nicotianae]|uniref:Uncharacterized protein n=1 Tax=Phytophthora nicotianae TaxID=4792 RepID=W2H5K4_PHYNI|nr:hypothetical protein L915_05769 [Phytophthora nicotianae]ETL97052.1 hypothetical protein L917_05594 [Phytophthora nicotianae]
MDLSRSVAHTAAGFRNIKVSIISIAASGTRIEKNMDVLY